MTIDGRISNENCMFSYRNINCQVKWSNANKTHFNAEKYVILGKKCRWSKGGEYKSWKTGLQDARNSQILMFSTV